MKFKFIFFSIMVGFVLQAGNGVKKNQNDEIELPFIYADQMDTFQQQTTLEEAILNWAYVAIDLERVDYFKDVLQQLFEEEQLTPEIIIKIYQYILLKPQQYVARLRKNFEYFLMKIDYLLRNGYAYIDDVNRLDKTEAALIQLGFDADLLAKIRSLDQAEFFKICKIFDTGTLDDFINELNFIDEKNELTDDMIREIYAYMQQQDLTLKEQNFKASNASRKKDFEIGDRKKIKSMYSQYYDAILSAEQYMDVVYRDENRNPNIR